MKTSVKEYPELRVICFAHMRFLLLETRPVHTQLSLKHRRTASPAPCERRPGSISEVGHFDPPRGDAPINEEAYYVIVNN